MNGVFNSILFFFRLLLFYIFLSFVCEIVNEQTKKQKSGQKQSINWTLNTFGSIRSYCDYLFSVEGFDLSNELLIVCLWSRLPASQHWCIPSIVVVDHWKILNGFEREKNIILMYLICFAFNFNRGSIKRYFYVSREKKCSLTRFVYLLAN